MTIARTYAAASALLVALPALLVSQVVDRPDLSYEEATDRSLYSNCAPIKVAVNLEIPRHPNRMVEALAVALNGVAENALHLEDIGINSEKGSNNMLLISAKQGFAENESLTPVFLSVQFIKHVNDDYGNRLIAIVWNNSISIPADESKLILGFFTDSITDFVTTYWKINSSACPHTE